MKSLTSLSSLRLLLNSFPVDKNQSAASSNVLVKTGLQMTLFLGYAIVLCEATRFCCVIFIFSRLFDYFTVTVITSCLTRSFHLVCPCDDGCCKKTESPGKCIIKQQNHVVHTKNIVSFNRDFDPQNSY